MKSTKDILVSLKETLKNPKYLCLYGGIFILTILFLVFSFYLLQTHHTAKSYEKQILQIANLNKDTIFSLDNIFIFSSATATNNTQTNSLWSLDIHQYSDIALFINNHATNGYTTKNTISKLYLDNFHINGISYGTPSLSYKDVQTFGKFVDLEENAISDTLTYTITNGNTVDSTIAQMDLSCKAPITLGFMNKNIKEGYTVVDTSSTLQYNGTLLKTATIPLTNITPSISFDIHIENALGETYLLNVNFTLPLEQGDQSIYNGTLRQNIAYNKAFFRIS